MRWAEHRSGPGSLPAPTRPAISQLAAHNPPNGRCCQLATANESDDCKRRQFLCPLSLFSLLQIPIQHTLIITNADRRPHSHPTHRAAPASVTARPRPLVLHVVVNPVLGIHLAQAYCILDTTRASGWSPVTASALFSLVAFCSIFLHLRWLDVPVAATAPEPLMPTGCRSASPTTTVGDRGSCFALGIRNKRQPADNSV